MIIDRRGLPANVPAQGYSDEISLVTTDCCWMAVAVMLAGELTLTVKAA